MSQRTELPLPVERHGENGWRESHGGEDFVDTEVYFTLCPQVPLQPVTAQQSCPDSGGPQLLSQTFSSILGGMKHL